MPRRLLNIASIVCLVLCVALMGMWVRSYYFHYHLHGRFTDSQFFDIEVGLGRLMLIEMPVNRHGVRFMDIKDWPWEIRSYPLDAAAKSEVVPEAGGFLTHIGFALSFGSLVPPILMLPYWFLVLTSGTLAMIFRMRWPWRFTLRHLFIVTTFLAVVLGMSAWLDRAWIGK